MDSSGYLLMIELQSSWVKYLMPLYIETAMNNNYCWQIGKKYFTQNPRKGIWVAMQTCGKKKKNRMMYLNLWYIPVSQN